jgi:hypothetical protein
MKDAKPPRVLQGRGWACTRKSAPAAAGFSSAPNDVRATLMNLSRTLRELAQRHPPPRGRLPCLLGADYSTSRAVCQLRFFGRLTPEPVRPFRSAPLAALGLSRIGTGAIPASAGPVTERMLLLEPLPQLMGIRASIPFPCLYTPHFRDFQRSRSACPTVTPPDPPRSLSVAPLINYERCYGVTQARSAPGRGE